MDHVESQYYGNEFEDFEEILEEKRRFDAVMSGCGWPLTVGFCCGCFRNQITEYELFNHDGLCGRCWLDERGTALCLGCREECAKESLECGYCAKCGSVLE